MGWRENLASLPWCEVYSPRGKRQRCQGLRWSQISLSADLSKYHCKKTAQWRYRYLQSHLLPNGKRKRTLYLCSDHVTSYMGMDEEDRIKKWRERIARKTDNYAERD